MKLSKEEKKAIEFLKIFSKTEIDYCKLEKADVLDILNVIEKQEKVIDEMADKLSEYICRNKEDLNMYKLAPIDEIIEKINKEKEKNKELEKDKKALVNNYSKVLGNFISRDKIREKIKELENILVKLTISFDEINSNKTLR